MSKIESIRAQIAPYLAPLMFVIGYTVTVVLGNLGFASPWGAQVLDLMNYPRDLLTFNTSFTASFWALLLMPYVVTPIVVIAARPALQTIVPPIVSLFPDFRRADYLVIAGILYAYIIWVFWRTDALGLLSGAQDGMEAVAARFMLQERMRFWELIVLQSLLPFLSFYAIVKAFKSMERFWIIAAASNIGAMLILFTIENRKWPTMVFLMGCYLCFFIFSKRLTLFRIVAAGALMLAVLVLVSGFVTRVVELPPVPPTVAAPAAQNDDTTTAPEYVTTLVGASTRHAPELVLGAIKRMAIVYPYYFNIFTNEGPVCGGIAEQAHRGVKCRPTNIVYRRLFPKDQFAAGGTAPAAAHISGYALGGFPIALLMLALASIIMCVFTVVPLDGGAMPSAIAVAGAVAGYHFSQMPVEGPVFYDHGLFWPFLLVCAYAGFRFITARWPQPAEATQAHRKERETAPV